MYSNIPIAYIQKNFVDCFKNKSLITLLYLILCVYQNITCIHLRYNANSARQIINGKTKYASVEHVRSQICHNVMQVQLSYYARGVN